MTLEIFAVVAAMVLFAAMFLGLLFSYQDAEAKRARPRRQVRAPSPALYGWQQLNTATAEELMLRQIEHHLRREALQAEKFVMDPSQQTLRAGEDLRLGMN